MRSASKKYKNMQPELGRITEYPADDIIFLTPRPADGLAGRCLPDFFRFDLFRAGKYEEEQR